MNRKKSRWGQPNTALPLHGLFTIHGPNLCWYVNIAKCKNVLNMGYIYHKKNNIFQNKLPLQALYGYGYGSWVGIMGSGPWYVGHVTRAMLLGPMVWRHGTGGLWYGGHDIEIEWNDRTYNSRCTSSSNIVSSGRIACYCVLTTYSNIETQTRMYCKSIYARESI